MQRHMLQQFHCIAENTHPRDRVCQTSAPISLADLEVLDRLK